MHDRTFHKMFDQFLNPILPLQGFRRSEKRVDKTKIRGFWTSSYRLVSNPQKNSKNWHKFMKLTFCKMFGRFSDP